jgi:hypothetical protein
MKLLFTKQTLVDASSWPAPLIQSRASEPSFDAEASPAKGRFREPCGIRNLGQKRALTMVRFPESRLPSLGRLRSASTDGPHLGARVLLPEGLCRLLDQSHEVLHHR